MTTDTQSVFKRDILSNKNNDKVSGLLQQNLVNLIDLALLLKQAHWNVVGANFRSIHLQLDEIIATPATRSPNGSAHWALCPTVAPQP